MALPLRKSIVINERDITINGKVLDQDQAINFKEACVVFNDNFARKVINEQIRYLAINLGVHIGLSPDTIMFSKAALWILEEEQKLLDQIYSS